MNGRRREPIFGWMLIFNTAVAFVAIAVGQVARYPNAFGAILAIANVLNVAWVARSIYRDRIAK